MRLTSAQGHCLMTVPNDSVLCLCASGICQWNCLKARHSITQSINRHPLLKDSITFYYLYLLMRYMIWKKAGGSRI